MINDKMKHMIAGMLIAAFVGIPAYAEDIDLFAGIWSALMSALFVAATKEWCDNKMEFNQWDFMDIVFTMIGAAVAAILIITLHFGEG